MFAYLKYSKQGYEIAVVGESVRTAQYAGMNVSRIIMRTMFISGGIAGLVTIEDTIEQIVGELEDEHDRTQHADPEQIGENKWSMPARTPIADLEEIFEIDIDEDDVDTVYGLLTKLLGRVPIVGSTAVTRGLRLTAVDSAGRRKKVSTIVVEPAHVEGVDETEQHEDHTNGAEEASHDDKDSKDKHD